MRLGVYREVLSIRRMPVLFTAMFLARIPLLGLGIALTLLVVKDLHLSYAAAGLVATSQTAGQGLGSPVRGRWVDRFGVRRSLLPSVVMIAVAYPLLTVAPYWGVVALAFFVGFFAPPVYTVLRLTISALVPADLQRTALSLDGSMGEAAFIIGPAIAAVVASSAGPGAAILWFGAVVLVSLALFWIVNPPTRSAASVTEVEATGEPASPRTGRWLNAEAIAMLVVSFGTMVAIIATDLSIVARLNGDGRIALLGIVYLGWGGASLVGGLIYGARHTSVSPVRLLAVMGLLTLPVALAHGPLWLSLALIPAGALVSPAQTAAIERLTAAIDTDRLGEAMGWLSSASLAGGALASPATGAIIDHTGAWGGFVFAGAVGILFAGAMLALLARRRDHAPLDV